MRLSSFCKISVLFEASELLHPHKVDIQRNAHLSNELYNLIEVVLLLQDLAHDLADVDEVRVKFVIEGFQGLGILAVADEPVHAGEVLALR